MNNKELRRKIKEIIHDRVLVFEEEGHSFSIEKNITVDEIMEAIKLNQKEK
jgi:hypothetical protein